MRKRTAILVTIVLLLGAVGGAAAAIGLGLDQEIGVAYGEVTYVASDLEVQSYSENGPGINTETVDVTINNTGSSSITADVNVYLMDSGSVVSNGTTSTTWSANEQKTVTVDVSPDVKQKDYTQVDIQVVE